MLHPLLNKESEGHYRIGDKSAIEELEKRATVHEQIGWCQGNIFKYQFRKERKGDKQGDEKKIATFKEYLRELTLMTQLAYVGDMIVAEAYKKLDKEWEYRLV